MAFFERITRMFCCIQTRTSKKEDDISVLLPPIQIHESCCKDPTVEDEMATTFVQKGSKEIETVTGEVAHNESLIPDYPLGIKTDSKPTLALDLDNTLVCPAAKIPVQPAHEIEILYNGRSQRVWIIERPFLADFLEALYEKYEIIIFTAGIKEYAIQALQKIDPNKRISNILDRSYCFPFGKNSKNQDIYLKNLNVLGRDLRRTLLVDDREYSYILNPGNGIHILPFFGDENDTALLSLKEYLLECAELEDLTVRKDWNNECK